MKKNVLILIIGFTCGMVFICFAFDTPPNTLNVIKTIASIFIAGSFIVASYQLILNVEESKYTKNWNRKQLTLTELNKSSKEINENIKVLDKYIRYRSLTSAITPKDFHKKMGTNITKNEFDVFEKDYNSNVVIEHIKGNKNYFKYTEEGRKIKDHTMALLSNLEYICAGINDDTLDEKLSKRMILPKLNMAVKVYLEYIKHLQNDHGFGPDVYNEILATHKKWNT